MLSVLTVAFILTATWHLQIQSSDIPSGSSLFAKLRIKESLVDKYMYICIFLISLEDCIGCFAGD